MTPVRTRVLTSGLAAALAAGSLLAAPAPAPAAPVFTQIEVDPYASEGLTGACTNTGPALPATPVTVLNENGTSLATSLTTTAQYTANGDPTDVMTNTATLQASSSASTAGGLPQSITTSFSGTVSATASKGASTCDVRSVAGVEVDFEFTTAVPLWATLSVHHKGPGYVEAYIDQDIGDGYHELYGRSLDGGGSTTVLLPPGTYSGYVEGDSGRNANANVSASVSGKASITFALPGSTSAAPSGKASKYVALPGARACGTHNATATLTAKKKALKQVKKVTFTVDGKKAATLKGKKLKKGRAVALPLVDSAAAELGATVLLKNGKERTVDASYLACTS
ncbi:hypothetical protein RB608_07685 [Nocardioides sp. LHD-245]|uniref:hypothetical protein n=1 Tax=Nocardioides sp. LHD-245 TaxID=3051387 RepID=UPI0027E12576|nr:hypothetical protein [Nocardioides sp. LHD-245]